MAGMDEIDRVLNSRLSGTPGADLRTLAGTLYRRQAGGTINYIGTIGNMSQIGTVLLTVHIGTVHKVDRIGTLDEVTTLGTMSHLKKTGTLGRLNYIEKIGSISRIGSLAHVGRIGTAHVGTVPVTIAAQDIMAGVDLQARYYSPVNIRGTTSRLGCGSIYTGSWREVDKFLTKSFMFKLSGSAPGKGSIALIGAQVGTGENDGTFTYYPWSSISKGSADTASFTESLQYVRPKVRQHGGPAGSWQPESGGTLQITLGRQT